MESKPEYEIQYSNYFVKNEINKKKYLKFDKKFRSGKVTQELLNYYSIGILTVFLKKSIFNNFIFDGRYNVIGDFDFFIKLSRKYKIAYVEKPLAIYRVHKNNYHSKHIYKLISELRFWIKKNKNTLNKENLSLFNQKFYLFKLKVKYILKNIWACSSVVERYVDIVEVISSILITPTKIT